MSVVIAFIVPLNSGADIVETTPSAGLEEDTDRLLDSVSDPLVSDSEIHAPAGADF